MSRTDKDRPYWVKRNDSTLLRYIDHDHLHFGHIVYRDRIVRDDEGNPIMHTVLRNRPVFNWNRTGLQGRNPWQYEEYESVEPVYERRVWFTYADHCTGSFDTRVPSHLDRRGPEPTCTPQLTLGVGYGYDKAPKVVKRGFNRTIRGAERAALRDYVKGVNAAGDWDDLDDSDVEVRVNAQYQDYWD